MLSQPRANSLSPQGLDAPHLVHLERGWTLWRAVCVRGAGFPARRVLELAAPAYAHAADRFLEIEDRCEAARLEALRLAEEGNRLGVEGSGSALSRAMKRLRAGQVPEPFDAAPPVAAAIERFQREKESLGAARIAVDRACSAAALEVGTALRAAAGDPSFRQAMLWQNRGVVKGSVDALLRKPAGAVDTKTREYERLMASYVQRYCVKNDTIGFFGPVGWGTIVDQGAPMAFRAGPGLVARRNVYLEVWGVQLLASTLSADPELRPHIAPRRMPTARVEGTQLFHSLGRSSELPEEYARILEACDGERTAAEIASWLCTDPSLGLAGPEEVFTLLDQLAEKRLVIWSLEVPTATAHPERAIRKQISRAPESEARQRALARIDEIERARDAIAAARDEAALDAALAGLESVFEQLTGVSGRRRGGETYAGRTLVFEDCVRDVQLEIGPALVRRLAPSLELLLRAARWYTHEIARRYEAALRALHARLREESGSMTVEFLQFLAQAEPLFSGSQREPSAIVREVIDTLRARWAAVLQIPEGLSRLERSTAALRPAVEAAFAAPHPGWPGARYHSPDVIVAAPSVDAIERGEYFFVLGELHTGDNTASNPVFLHQHPEPAELVRAVEHDLPIPRVSPVVPKERSTRADQISISRHDLDVEFGATRSSRPRDRVLAVSDLLIEDVGGTLQVHTRDGSQRFHVLAFFEHYLKLESIAHFTLLPLADHTPRVTIDDLVVARERWRYGPADLNFASAPDPVGRFLAVRRWVAGQRLPRLVFVKVPEEMKPCFIDFESPVFVEIFAKLARRTTSMVVTEMLPAIDDAWLTDADGHGFTSELRMVAVDPEAWAP